MALSLTEALAQQTVVKGPRCTMAGILEKYPNPDELVAALNDPTVEHTRLARALTSLGYPVKPHTIGRHRAKGCDCAQ